MNGESKNPGRVRRWFSRRRFLYSLTAAMTLPLLNVLFRFISRGAAAEPEIPSPRILPGRTHREFAAFPGFTRTGTLGMGTSPAGDTELLATALRDGVSLLDTSPDYYRGETERRVGEALRHASGPVFLMTQIEAAAWKDGDLQGALHRSLENSLLRLDRSRVEALLVRNAEPRQLSNPAFRRFAETVKSARKVKYLGASGHGPDLEKVLEVSLADDLLEIILFGAHLSRFQTVPELLPRAVAAGKTLVAMKTREAGMWNRVEGWEREEERRRHSPWKTRWDPEFTRRSVNHVLEETGAHNAVVSLEHPEEVAVLLGR